MASIQITAAVLLLLLPARHAPAASDAALAGPAGEVFRRAQASGRFAQAASLNPRILPTSDGRSFVAVWKPAGAEPARWIVSLHGSRGFATDDLAVWHPHLEGREVGLVCLQWWIGVNDDTAAYYTPEEIYREADAVLRHLGARPGTAMLHGFSRGSANAYAVAALDAGRGRRYFSLDVASSGGVAPDYPPTRAIPAGAYGDRPLRGTRWVTAAGARDPNPERDGIPGMRRTAEWLREQGATVVLAIEDVREGHGALQRNPANARAVLNLFLGAPATRQP